MKIAVSSENVLEYGYLILEYKGILCVKIFFCAKILGAKRHFENGKCLEI